MSRKASNILGAILFVCFFTLVVQGQKNIGLTGLITELAGMFGLIGLLHHYNKRFK